MMQMINHENVAKVIDMGSGDYVLHNGTLKGSVYYIVMDLAEKHTLLDYIVDQPQITEPLAAHLFSQYLQGLYAIQSQGLCHRNIKCENILLDDHFKVKIADFTYGVKLGC